MNILGLLNWISGVVFCVGNIVVVNRLVCGWFLFFDFLSLKCIVLFGYNLKCYSWIFIYNFICKV